MRIQFEISDKEKQELLENDIRKIVREVEDWNLQDAINMHKQEKEQKAESEKVLIEVQAVVDELAKQLEDLKGTIKGLNDKIKANNDMIFAPIQC